jgi:hypothetical protein
MEGILSLVRNILDIRSSMTSIIYVGWTPDLTGPSPKYLYKGFRITSHGGALYYHFIILFIIISL